jgi:hypothetical protein
MAGGLSIKKIRTFGDNASTPVIKSYEYLTVGAAPYVYSDFFHYEMIYKYYFQYYYFCIVPLSPYKILDQQ